MNIKELEIKKMLKEIEYLESDYEYRSEIISNADSDFISNINSFLHKHPQLKELFDKKIDDRISNKIQELQTPIEAIVSDIDEDIERVDNTKAKNIYRDIVKITHPDKSKDKKMNDFYVRANYLYKKNDIVGLFLLCDQIGIDKSIDEFDINLLISKIKSIKDKIDFIESTFTWKWYYCKDDSEKNNILFSYIKNQLS